MCPCQPSVGLECAELSGQYAAGTQGMQDVLRHLKKAGSSACTFTSYQASTEALLQSVSWGCSAQHYIEHALLISSHCLHSLELTLNCFAHIVFTASCLKRQLSYKEPEYSCRRSPRLLLAPLRIVRSAQSLVYVPG